MTVMARSKQRPGEFFYSPGSMSGFSSANRSVCYGLVRASAPPIEDRVHGRTFAQKTECRRLPVASIVIQRDRSGAVASRDRL